MGGREIAVIAKGQICNVYQRHKFILLYKNYELQESKFLQLINTAKSELDGIRLTWQVSVLNG